MSEFSEDTLGRTFFSKDNETYSLKIITEWLKHLLKVLECIIME